MCGCRLFQAEAADRPSILPTIAAWRLAPDESYLVFDECLFFQRKMDGNTDVYSVDARVIEALRLKELR